MAFPLSPSVTITETDLTTIVPNVATSVGGSVGAFLWGPVGTITQISTENELRERFGDPDNTVFEDWFSMANFLSYTNNLLLVRVVDEATALNSVVDGAGTAGTPILVKNRDDYEQSTFTDQLVVGKYPSTLGNSIKVHMVDGGAFDEWKYDGQFDRSPGTSSYVNQRGGSNDEIHVIVIDEDGKWTGTAGTILEKFSFLSKALDAKRVDGSTNYYLNVLKNESRYVWAGDPTELAADVGSDSTTAFTTQTNDNTSDEVVDATITTPGSGYAVDETFTWTDGGATVQATGKITAVGGTGEITAVEITSRGEGYTSAPTTVSIDTAGGTGAALTGVLGHLGVGGSLTGGTDANSVTDGDRQAGWALFQDSEEVDVNLLFAAGASVTTGKWIIDNVAENRRDLVVCVSPAKASAVNNTGNELTDVKSDGSSYGSSSYAIMDNTWKYQLDRYNDVERFVPMNGDIAGLMARTDFTNDPWFPPAGFNRGVIKNVLKLSWRANKSERDALYQVGINPVVNFSGQGIILFGDKTMLDRPSAFDRINVRRLFITLEKAIATAAKFQLFEINDSFTRSQFKAMIEPFLRTVQGRRGIIDFKVVADESNNTGDIIDRNEFVADIFIKPSRSINFIQLNFVATRTETNFEEIGG